MHDVAVVWKKPSPDGQRRAYIKMPAKGNESWPPKEVGTVTLLEMLPEEYERIKEVYMDITVGGLNYGRVVYTLDWEKAPKSSLNFCVLCCGGAKNENGALLTYRNTPITQIKKNLLVQCGNLNGAGGESIYGPTFEDEKSGIALTEGVIAMANAGEKNTNGSQFFICLDDLTHLENHVGFGKVKYGLGIMKDISNLPLKGHTPEKKVQIVDCGAFTENHTASEEDDKCPPYPEDFQDEINMSIVKEIKETGNNYFKLENYGMALLKYNKALRYLERFRQSAGEEDSVKNLQATCLTNIAAVNIKCEDYKQALQKATEALHVRPTAKGFYRRGQSNAFLHNYKDALVDLGKALEECNEDDPFKTQIRNEIFKVEKTRMEAHNGDAEMCSRMFSFRKS